MIRSTFLQASLSAGRRLLQVICFGKNDVRTPEECAPAGYDSSPIKDMIAIYAETTNRGLDTIVGYINESQIAKAGEVRIFSQDSSGAEKAHVYITAAGKVNLGGTGSADNPNHATQWEALNTQMQSSIVNFINTQLPLIAAGIAAGGGSYTPGTMSLNITTAKLNNILTE